MSVIPAPRRLKQKDSEFKAGLSCAERPFLKKRERQACAGDMAQWQSTCLACTRTCFKPNTMEKRRGGREREGREREGEGEGGDRERGGERKREREGRGEEKDKSLNAPAKAGRNALLVCHGLLMREMTHPTETCGRPGNDH
jgi:hypothetical protein